MHTNYRDYALVLLLFGWGAQLVSLACIVMDRLNQSTADYPIAIAMSVAGLVMGNLGFMFRRRADALQPREQPFPETQTFHECLRSKRIAEITVAFEYIPLQPSPTIPQRIRTRIQRCLMFYCAKIDALGNDRHTEIDLVLDREVESIKREVGLSLLTLSTQKAEELPMVETSSETAQ